MEKKTTKTHETAIDHNVAVNSSFCPMLKVKLQLEAETDIERTGWKKGDILELVNEIFDKNCGIAYFPLDKGWNILKMEILASDPN